MGWGPVPLAVFIPVLGMVAIFVLNHALAHQRSTQQAGRDARGLRTALLAELILLRGLIADNLLLVRRNEEYVLSFRVLTQVYRSNVGRLNLLDEGEIDAVVSAYGTTEATEVHIGATTKPHGSHAYRTWLGDASWNDTGHRLETAQAAVDVAIARLGQTRRRKSDLRNNVPTLARADSDQANAAPAVGWNQPHAIHGSSDRASWGARSI